MVEDAESLDTSQMMTEPSITQNAERDILPWNIPTAAYLHGVNSAYREVSPLTADLTGFPPTCVTWGGDEMFRDTIRRYVERLRQAAIPIETQEFDGMFHVFQILMPWAEASREAFSMVRSFVHKIVADAPPLTKELLTSAE